MADEEIKSFLKRQILDEYYSKIGLGEYSHFSIWNSKLRTKVMCDENGSDDMLLVLDGTLVKPSPGSDPAEIKAWEKLDRKVKRVLLNSVDWTFYYLIDGDRTAHEMYAEIQSSIVQVSGSDNMVDFLRQMKATQQTNQEAQHISKLEDDLDELTQCEILALFIHFTRPSSP